MKSGARRLASFVRRAMVFSALALTIAGCGLKGDPVPVASPAPGAVAAPSVQWTDEGARVGWRFDAPAGAAASFQVERAKVDQACPGCPQKFELVAKLTRAQAAAGKNTYGYLDRVRKSDFPRWRIRACNDRGRCGEAMVVE